jgi:hypothetical protein
MASCLIATCMNAPAIAAGTVPDTGLIDLATNGHLRKTASPLPSHDLAR